MPPPIYEKKLLLIYKISLYLRRSSLGLTLQKMHGRKEPKVAEKRLCSVC
jgi:hypothetical protein